jgi:hypothetical protein
VVPVSFHDFFGGCASVAGALIGLLFVAISVSPEKLTGENASPDHQIRAGAAFSALVNTLVIALVALLPGASLGEAGITLAIAGLASTAGLIVLLYREHQQRLRRGDAGMLAILLALYGLQLANAMQVERAASGIGGVTRQGGLCIGFFLFGIARSWQLAGARDLSLVSAVAGMIHRPEGKRPHPAPGGHAGEGQPGGEPGRT